MGSNYLGLVAVAALLSWGAALADVPSLGRPRSVLEDLKPDALLVSEKTREGLRISDVQNRGGVLRTEAEFKAPLIITAIARTNSTNIRLYYGSKGVIIFNWEVNPKELRIQDPKTGVPSGIANQGDVPQNTWVAIRWIITKEESRVEVDGVERATIRGDYGDLSGTIGVSANSRSVVTVRSLTVTSIAPKTAASALVQEPIEVEVPSARPAEPARDAAQTAVPVSDDNKIERPEYQDKPKRLVKNLSSVTSMMVRIADDGYASGLTSDIIATVPAQSRNMDKAGIGFYRTDGDAMMKSALEEAVRAVTIRYPLWEPGHIDVSFGEKFTAHGGPSAGTAFGLLMLSTLEGFDIDPKCAVTGDITVDWKVRKVGGVTAKLRAAALDKCLYAAIPESNETAFADMGILYGNSALWEIQVFSIANLQQAIAIARTDRPAQLAQAIKLFSELQPQFTKSEKSMLQSADTRKTLKKILELAPNHLSAKRLLALCEGSAPKTLSANATMYQLSVIFYPYRSLLDSGERVDRKSLPSHITALARKRLEALRPMADKELLPLLLDMSAFIEACDGLAGRGVPANTAIARAENLEARFASLSSDPAFFERLVREGY